MIERIVGWDWRKIIADSIAFILYTGYTGWIIVMYEWYFCDLAVERVALLRIMSGAPRVLLGFVCGPLEKKIQRRLFGDASDFLHQAIAGAIALGAFQLLFYIPSAWVMSAGARQIIITCALYLVCDVALGWSFVKVFHWMRIRFGAGRGS